VSRIARAFETAKNEGRGALIAYVMAGDPTPEASEAYALACERGGADILELGVPFTDPVADGPDIQRAAQRALVAGMNLRRGIGLVERIRRGSDVPIALMGYYNPIFAMGDEAFAERAAAARVDGVIVPDLPPEEADGLRTACRDRGLDLVFLVSPATDRERAERIASLSSGFVYLVSRYGITGTSERLSEDLSDRVAGLRKVSRMPVAVGFGISTPAHVRLLVRAGAQGAVVGSAIVREIGRGAPPDAIESFVRKLATGLQTEPRTPEGFLPDESFRHLR